MIRRYIKSEHGKTVYWISCGEEAGEPGAKEKEKPWVVMLHGLTADHRLFDRQTEAFEENYRLMVWDCPCHGESREYESFTYDFADQELERILDREGVRRAVFVGQSLGEMLAQNYIDHHPDQAAGFLSVDSVPFGDYYSRQDLFWLKQLEWMSRLFPDPVLRSSLAKVCGTTAYTRASMKEMLAVYSKKELCHLIWAGEAGFIPVNREVRLVCPGALLLGDCDKVGKVRQYNLEWHRRTDWPLHVIRGAAHNANQDNPRAVNALIRRYVERWT